MNYLQYLLKLPKSEMLSKFFYCQLYDKNPNDWSEQVKKDLVDLNLTTNLQEIESMSQFSWKNLVKKKVKVFELEKLVEIKHLKNRSKMKSLTYEKLELQDYLTRLDVFEAKIVFRFRVRMAQFSDNFRGTTPPAPCPLCAKHLDLQEMSFLCPIVKEKMQINENYENIFKQQISNNLAKILVAIMKLRK